MGLATKQITIKIPSPLSQQVQKQSVIRDIGLCKLILSWGQADFYGCFVLCNFSSSPKYFLSDAMMGSDINNIFTSIKCTFGIILIPNFNAKNYLYRIFSIHAYNGTIMILIPKF